MGGEIGPKVVEYARAKKRTKVGSGECFDLADAALKDAAAKTAADFGEVTANADYVWGSEVPLTSVRAGDVLQYRDYVMKKRQETSTTYTFADGSTIDVSGSSESSLSRPHHTAIATGVPASGALQVIEQNVERTVGRGAEKLVDDGEIYLQSMPRKTTTSRETVRIDAAWGLKVKKIVGAKNAAAIDKIVQKNNGKTATADNTIDETITVTGTLTAYRPQAK